MKHNSDAPGQLALFAIAPTVQINTAIHDPYWDETETPAQQFCGTVDQNFNVTNATPLVPERSALMGQFFVDSDTDGASWNEADFGEVPHKLDSDGQLSIFYDNTQEPPDPDDYQKLTDYHRAWSEWRTRVGAQVTVDTVTTTVKPRVGAQVTTNTKKTAPQHDTHWVEKYWVERSGNKYWYFRYCWMVGRKKNRRYIGSVDSIISKRKKAAVEIAINDGRSPVEIEKLIRQQRGQVSLERCLRRAKPSQF